MKVYQLRSTVGISDCYVQFLNHQDRIIRYFVFNEGTSDFLKFGQLSFAIPDALAALNLSKIDYLEGFMDMHFFSPRLCSDLRETLSEEIEFYPCQLISKGKIVSFFAARFIKYVNLVDEGKSSFSTFSDGMPKLERIVCVENAEFEFAGRDLSFRLVSAVTQRFKDLTESIKFGIGFLERVQ